MPSVDMSSRLKGVASPDSFEDLITGDGITTYNVVDTSNFESCEIMVISQTSSDNVATVQLLCEESDSSQGPWSAVEEKYYAGDLSDARFSIGVGVIASFEIAKIGYVGNKRYIRPCVEVSNSGLLAMKNICSVVLGSKR